MYRVSQFSKKLVRAVGTAKFFRVLLLIFAVEALWIALTGKYPMAFDENFHFGIIQIYAHHLNPFLSQQPPGADAFGAVARDPSYLYHYLMSFPYRLISVFTRDQTIQVIILRLINIALFVGGLPLYRRLLKKTGASDTVVNLCFMVFILLPVAPLLAAQINYDNLFLPIVALTLLLALRVTEELERHSRVDFVALALLGMACLLGSLIKYPFLPIFLAIGVFLVWRFWQFSHGKRRLIRAIRSGFRRLRAWQLGLLVAGLLLSLCMFGQRYGINMVRYGTPIPGCAKVLSIQQCSAYGPWERNYYDASIKPSAATRNPLVFTGDWFYGMWFRLFFAVDGPGTGFETRGPLLLPGIGSIVFAGIGFLLLVYTFRRLWNTFSKPVLSLSILTILIYAGALWFDNYQDFLLTGQPVAINGRYLLPVMLPFLLLLALAYRDFFKRLGSKVKLELATVYAIVVCLVFGGGALTYILRSNDDWYWPSPVVKTANHAVKKVAKHIVPGSSHPDAFLKSQ